MSAHFEPPQKVCSVLGAFLRYRGLAPLAEPLRPDHVRDADTEHGLTPSDAVKSILDVVKRWEVIAARRAESGALSHLTYIVVITSESGEAHRAKSLEDRFVQAPVNVARAIKQQLPLSEVIVIAPDEVVAKKNLQEVVSGVREQMRGVHISFYPHSKFSTVVPEQRIVPHHEVADPEDVARYLQENHIQRDQLPGITASDAAVIWCGARRGQVVRILRVSETVGEFVPVFRLVK